MTTSAVPLVPLNDGTTLPAVGFGTYQLKGEPGVETMIRAIRNGYRLIDSAVNYGNEEAVGEAVRRAGASRSTLRITSKLPGRDHRFDDALRAIEGSLHRAQLDYYDLYLIHWPNPIQGLYVEAWKALLEARNRGLVRSVGVSNFLPEHLDRIIGQTGVVPSVNQVELHPYFPQAAQLAFNRSLGIVTESWSPLGRAHELVEERVLQDVAARVRRSVPQVILRWHHQLGAIPIPKATSDARQAENLAIFDFDLSPADMAAIGSLARPDGRLAGQDPASHEEF